MKPSERAELIEELKRQGFAIQVKQWPAKATYYKPTGEAMHNLPADPVTMRRYMNKGFTLVPPKNPVVIPSEEVPPLKRGKPLTITAPKRNILDFLKGG